MPELARVSPGLWRSRRSPGRCQATAAEKKSRPRGAGGMSRGRRRLAPPRRQSGTSAYLEGGAIGCRARAAAPIRGRDGASGWGPGSLQTRDTVGRGASCATPCREVALDRRLRAAALSSRRRPGRRPKDRSSAADAAAAETCRYVQWFGMGPGYGGRTRAGEPMLAAPSMPAWPVRKSAMRVEVDTHPPSSTRRLGRHAMRREPRGP